MTAVLTDAQRKLASDHVWVAEQAAAFACSKHPSHDFAALFSDAQLGLIDAASRYDSTRDAKFKTFAFPRIRGAITDGLRTRDRLTRADRALASRIDRIRSEFNAREHRFPTLRELARDLGMRDRTLWSLLGRLSRAGCIPLDERAPDSEDSWHNMLPDETAQAALDAIEQPTKQLLDQVHALPTQQQLTVLMYYWERCTLREISDVLEVTESRVSQILTKALAMLRTTVPRDLLVTA